MGVHDGHRKRLRERYKKEGLGGFADHEILELLLFYSIPQRDTNPIAHKLIAHFGNIKEVFLAPINELVKVDGITENSAVLISMLPKIMAITMERENLNTPLDSAKALGNFCRGLFYGDAVEKLKVICFDSKLKVVGYEQIADGTMGKLEYNVRSIVEVAIKYQVDIVAITHNHPRGSSMPSNADLAATTLIKNTLSSLGIKLIDHIIVGEDKTTSLKEDGFMFDL